MSEDTAEKPGTIVQIDKEGMQIAAKGGKLKIEKVRSEGTAKVPATDYASESGLKPGAADQCAIAVDE